MNLESEILKEHSKRQAVKIGKWVGSNPKRFKQLMELFLHGEYRVTQRSAWIIGHCAENHPRLIVPWLPKMVKKMQEQGVHVAVKRNVVRILQWMDIPRPLLGTVVTFCFNELHSVDSPIAVQAHAMIVLANAAKREPDIIHELKASIEQLQPHASPGLCVRIKNVLKQLNEIE